jgi:hypothetical protein
MSAMDVDADGKIDLIVPNFSGNNFSVFRNTSSVGNISFAARVDITTPSGPTSVALGDMDGDGKIDVATVNQTAGNVALFKNTGTTGTISFGTGVNFSTLSSPIAAAIGDIDGDGRPDLAVTSSVGNAISVFRNMNIAPEPTLQATGVSVSSITNTSMQVSWTNGNGSGRLVLARAGSAVTNDPVDENWYTASAAFGSGTQIGSGNFVLHAGSANNVVVTGLSPVSTYHYKVYEYNGTLGATNYLITSAPIGNATTLPVSLIYFGVTQSGREALLTWATSSEQNNMGFVVERSMDMQTWDYLGFVSGSGNSMEVRNYQYRDGISDWMDKHAVIYYRLRQQDMDGREEILPVKKLTLGMQSKAESLAYPNPATTYVILQSGWQLNGTEKSYRIVDIMGKEVRSKQAMSSTTQVVSLDGLQEGIYFIEMQDTMGNTQRLKVVKE